MNKKLVLHMLGRLMLVEAGLMLPSLIIAWALKDGDEWPFLLSMLITVAVALPLTLFTRGGDGEMHTREGMAVAGLSWLTFSLFGSLPLLLDGACGFWDALFEIASGFTTTGATIFGDVESLPRGLLFWRSFTHWAGGMGVLVLTSAILPSIDGRGAHLARAESPGPSFSKLRPRLGDSAKALYMIYAALTLVEYVFLRAFGMPVFDAVIHTLGTAGTGGFSCRNTSVGAYGNPAFEIIIAVFMLLFGVNFAVYFRLLMRDVRGAGKNEELWVYTALTAVATLLIAANVTRVFGSFTTALRHAFFQTTSIMSTTGYSSADFELWPAFSKAVIAFLMFFGACAGSTAGGLKIVRILLLAKMAGREVLRAFQPRKVRVVRLDGKSVPEEMLSGISIFFFVYIALVLLGALTVASSGANLVTSFTASLTCVSNVGPGFGAVGPMCNFGFLPSYVKAILTLLMLAGRLEIYPMLVLLVPSMWKKA